MAKSLFYDTTLSSSLLSLVPGQSNYEVNVMLNKLWNSIESSSHRNSIILAILLTSFIIILILIMKILFKTNKNDKNQ